MAGSSLGVLTLDLVAKTGGFVGGLDKAERAAKKSASQIDKSNALIAKSFKGIGIGVAAVAVAGIGAAFATMVKETQEAQQEQAQLAAALDSTGRAAGYTQASLNSMADTLSKGIGIDDGEITKAQTALLAFTKIAGEQFPKAITLAADISARKGMDLVSASELLGKALDSPTKGLAALGKQGIRFSEDQKKAIEAMEQTGNVAGAQNIILGELEKKFGGAAKAARDTFGGALTGLGAAFKNLMTGDDASFSGAAKAVNELTDTLNDPQVKAGIGTLVSGFAEIASGAVIATAKTASFIAQGPAFFKFLAGSVDTESLGQVGVRLGEIEVELGKINEKRAEGFRLSADDFVTLGALQKEQRELEGVVKAHNDKANAVIMEQRAVAEAAVVTREATVAEEKNNAAMEKAAKIRAENQKYVSEKIAALREELEVMGMTAQALDDRTLKLHNATAGERDQAKALHKTLEARRNIAKEMAELDGLAAPTVGDTGSSSNRLDELSRQFASERELELERYKQERDDFQEHLDLKGGMDAGDKEKMEALEKTHKDILDSQDENSWKNRKAGTQEALGTIAGLMSSGSKKLFEIGKIGAIANATVSMFDGVMKAWALGPILGPILAPLVAVAGITNINGIKNTKFGGGGGSPAASSSAAASAVGGGSSPAPAQQQQRTNVTLVGDTFNRESIIQMLNSAFKDGYTLDGMRA